MDLTCCLDHVLEMGTGEEVTEVYEFAMFVVFDVDSSPAVLSCRYDLTAARSVNEIVSGSGICSPIDFHGVLGSDNSERNERLLASQYCLKRSAFMNTYLDLRIQSSLLRIVLVILVRVHSDVVEREFLLDAILELLTLLHGEGVSLGDHWHHVDGLAQLLEHDNVDWSQAMARRVDEVQTAVDARVLDVPTSDHQLCLRSFKYFLHSPFTLSCQLFPQVCGVLVLDVFDDRIPAAVVVDQVTIAGGVDDVEPKPDAVLLDHMSNRMDLGRLANAFLRRQAALGFDEVRGEDGVDERRLAETGLT